MSIGWRENFRKVFILGPARLFLMAFPTGPGVGCDESSLTRADHHDPQRAAAVRKTLLDKIATNRERVIGFHLPFPGIGVVERCGSSYRFVPA